MSLLSNLFNSNEKEIKKLDPLVKQINALESEFENFSQEQLIQKTKSWQEELKHIHSDQEIQKKLDALLPEAFAAVREAAKRTLGQRHYDVQLMGGIVLHQGKIAEQKTGEGKTLTATLPLYLNALTGKGAHLVTPNDYLSRHGAGWMGQVFNYLGLSVSVIMQERAFKYDPEFDGDEFKDEFTKHLRECTRREAYECDITYGTNHEFGFDYLRDNMARARQNIVQTNPKGEFGAHNFAIVDEVDSILIDIARTPLIISTSVAQPSERYLQASQIVGSLIKDTDYEVEEKFRNASLTDLGVRKVEKMLGNSNLYEEDFEMVHLIEQALSAHALYTKDKDYIVKDGQVIVIDQSTGRLLPSNRFSHGTHQAIEAKEGVEIKQESRSVAEISYQNYFRMYDKLAGMTGTALTEAEEFYKIYKLDVVALPTNKPVARVDHNDVVYKTESAKFRAVADEIAERSKAGQPVLVGTTSVEKSQILHELLRRRGVQHEILNAKNHSREAKIISQAGKTGAVTVSTNMAGRGVDIILGGEDASDEERQKIKDAGGLHVIGTERHESRRIDNQLRGRSGRQGDPGSSKFYVSLQDELMRVFGGSQVEGLMNRFGMEENVPLEAGIVSKAIENAQKKVEGFNFDRRKRVVEMDDVINVHRDVVYTLRKKIMFGIEDSTEFKEWFIKKLVENTDFDPTESWEPFEEKLGLDLWLNMVFQLSWPVIDTMWMEHLVDMDHLREAIGLRGYAQRDPMVEYKKEGHARFEILITKMYQAIAERLSNVSIEGLEQAKEVFEKQRAAQQEQLAYSRGELNVGVADEAAVLQKSAKGSIVGSVAPSGVSALGVPTNRIEVQPVKSNDNKVGRNDPCPCGSGLKYKKCGMINAPEHKA